MAGHALTFPWFFAALFSHHTSRPRFRFFLPGVFSHAGGATGSFASSSPSSPSAAVQKPHVFEHTFFMNLGLLSHLPWAFFLSQNFFLYLPSFFASRLSTHGGSSSSPSSSFSASSFSALYASIESRPAARGLHDQYLHSSAVHVFPPKTPSFSSRPPGAQM